MDDNARDLLLDYIFENGDPEELSKIEELILSSKVIREACKRELKKVSIERFLDDVMTTDEEEYFEKMLAEDQSMVYDLSFMRRINEAIEAGMLQDALVEICKKEIVLSPKEEKEIDKLYRKLSRKRRPVIKMISAHKKWIAAASITLLILFGGSMAYHLQTAESLENRLYEKYYEPVNENAAGFFVKNTSLLEAKKKYLQGDYKLALLLYENLPNTLSVEAEKNFYLGLTLMELEDFETALIKFKDLYNHKDGKAFLPVVDWYMGLCYLKTNQNKEAVKKFEKIVINNGYNAKKAEKILKRLH